MHKLHPGTAMVAFFLPEDEATRLAISDGEPADNLHVTSLYVEDTSEIQEKRAEALALVRSLAGATPPFSGVLNRLSHFGPDGDGLTAVVFELDSQPAHWFQAQLKVDFSDSEIPYSRKFPEYRPHVTIGYWPEDEIPERFSKPGPLDNPIPVTFSEVSMKWDGEQTDVPLGATVASVQPLEFDWRNQPRDSEGRWRETGSWGRPGKGTPVIGFVRRGAEDYRKRRGLPDLGSSVNVVADEARSKEIAAAYQALPANDPKAHASFRQFAKEIDEQYEFVTSPASRGGLGMKIEVVDKDPYATHRELAEDVLKNRRIRVLATKTTGSHDFLTDEQNDRFRAIHDLFGHLSTGRPFDRHGEEAAWLEHASMFSELARGAMTTETRGQNSVLINTGSFAQQKIGLLPKKFYSDEALRRVKRSSRQRIVGLASEDTTDSGDNREVNPISVLQASAFELEENRMRFSVVQPLEFHGVNTHNEKAHGRRGPGVDADIDISIPRIKKGGRIPAAKPTSKAELEAHDPGKGVRVEFSLHTDKQKAVVLAKVAKVPGFEDVEGLAPDEAEKVIRNRLSRNLEELFDRSVEVYGKDRTLEHASWYPTANQEGKKWAKEFGFEEDAVFAALAALSPNADWADNVAWARFIAEKVSNQDNESITQEIVDAFEAAQVVAYEGQLKKFKNGRRPTEPKFPEPSGLPVGAKLSELDDEMAAKAIRGMGNHEVLMQSLFGNPETKASANSGLFISNAISILRNPAVENIDKRLGKEHKVRSFYNNIRDPLDTEFEDVTGDTHHFGAAYGHPWPGQSRFLASGKKGEENVNVWSANKSGETGATGTYPLLVEATRQAAAAINERYELDLRPNQIQSVVWEYHRNTWPSKARTEGVRKSVEEIRTKEAKGELTHAQAEDLIEEIRAAAPTAAPKDKLLDQMLGAWKPGKRTRKRVV